MEKPEVTPAPDQEVKKVGGRLRVLIIIMAFYLGLMMMAGLVLLFVALRQS